MRRQFSKYHAKKVMVDGVMFDSVREARRWSELKILEKAGIITDLQRQVPFTLIPSQPVFDPITGKKVGTERPVKYIADFVYYTQGGYKVVEDTKGMRTKDYIIKRKLLLHKFGIAITEV